MFPWYLSGVHFREFHMKTNTDSNLAKNEPTAAESLGEERPDVAEIMSQIRRDIKEAYPKLRDQRKAFQPKQADFESKSRAGELLHSEELRFLNSNFAFGPNLNLDSVTSHRPGIFGKLIVKAKRKFLAIIWDLLKDYFSAEREFHANLVRYLNHASKYVDERDAGNFWELIRKIDYDNTKALERIERIGDEQSAALRSSERRLFDSLDASIKELNSTLGRLDTSRAVQENEIQTLDRVVKGLESLVARVSAPESSALEPQPQSTPQTDGQSSANLPDYSYLLLENRFRGSEQEIMERQRFYPGLFDSALGKVLEIGPGRGELQELFKEAGVTSYGVDTDAGMIEHATKRGLNVQLGDGIEHLAGLADASIGGVIALQVVEHLPRQVLERLCQLCRAKVAPGGTVIFETINPKSVLALSSNYFRDPTHVWPQHPDTLAYTMELAGLAVEEVRELAPVSDEAQLRPLETQEFMTPRWSHVVGQLNRNFDMLNGLLYGNQDYCIVAKVPQA